MKWVVTFVVALGLSGSASAESCTRSLEYILDGLAGDLPRPAADYQSVFKVCIEALKLSNVKDAYVLKDGGIALDPRRNTLTATAVTLAQFCQQFPKGTARFLTPQEQRKPRTVGLIVMLSSKNVTPCRTVQGGT